MKNINHEKYALLTIVDMLSLDPDNFLLEDSPDIQNVTDSIGIEVTRAVRNCQVHAAAIAQKYLGEKRKNKNGIEIEQIIIGKEKHFRKNGSILLTSDDIPLICPTKGPANTYGRLTTAEQSIKSKNKKCHNYKQFEAIYLYLFLETAVFEDFEIYNFLKSVFPQVAFQMIFINCISVIYSYDGKCFQNYPLSLKKREYYHTQSAQR